jgi:ribosome-associated toxin RatA of RatAB toxin-antitoxin module
MKHVQKSVLLWYSPREMYGLVTDVASYPQFLPWCETAETIEVHEDGGTTARLGLHFAGVRHTFTTRNDHEPDRSVRLTLVDGPFSLLDGSWVFVPLPTPSGMLGEACRIEFELRYAFASSALEVVVSPVFDRIANTLVDSFVKRAEQVYGNR